MSTLHLPDPAATHALGRHLGRFAMPGTFLALIGDLGAGKTALVKGVGEGLGVRTTVQSPSFVLVQGHQGRLRLWHVDLYRLVDASELDVLGLDDLEGGVVAVEWADRFPELWPADRLEIRLTDAGGGRQADLVATGPRHRWLEDAVVDP